MIKVLYLTHGRNIGGANLSLVNLLHSVRDIVEPVIVCTEDSPVAKLFKENGYKTLIVPYKLNIASSSFRWLKKIPRTIVNSYCNTMAIRRLTAIIQAENIQIIHSNTSVLTIGYDLSKYTGIKHVWHLRELPDLHYGYAPFCGWNRLRMMLCNTDAVIAITNVVANHFVTTKQPNIYIINDAVIASKKDIVIEEKDRYILFCGNITPNKGAELALDIFVDFHRTHPDYELFYVGDVDTEYREYLNKKAKTSGVESNVRFLGFQKNVAYYFKKALAFLMCSRYEAMGRVTVEAMFYGCPVLGFCSGGTKEIIRDGKTGYLFNDVTEAVSKLCSIVDNITETQKIIYAAHQMAIEQFSEDKYGKAIVSIYRSLLS